MAKRGPKSAAELSVVVNGKFDKRPDAPGELNENQRRIWDATVASEAEDFFGTAALKSMLADYCRHRETADAISGVINEFPMEYLKNASAADRLRALLNMREKETAAATRLATKLRITNQARYTPSAAATATRNNAPSAPWDFK